MLPTRLCRAATTKPRQIERSSFFLLDHNDKTRIYRPVSGSFDVLLRRKRDSPMEEDDCAPPALIRVNKEISLEDFNAYPLIKECRYSVPETNIIIHKLDFSLAVFSHYNFTKYV